MKKIIVIIVIIITIPIWKNFLPNEILIITDKIWENFYSLIMGDGDDGDDGDDVVEIIAYIENNYIGSDDTAQVIVNRDTVNRRIKVVTQTKYKKCEATSNIDFIIIYGISFSHWNKKVNTVQDKINIILQKYLEKELPIEENIYIDLPKINILNIALSTGKEITTKVVITKLKTDLWSFPGKIYPDIEGMARDSIDQLVNLWPEIKEESFYPDWVDKNKYEKKYEKKIYKLLCKTYIKVINRMTDNVIVFKNNKTHIMSLDDMVKERKEITKKDLSLKINLFFITPKSDTIKCGFEEGEWNLL